MREIQRDDADGSGLRLDGAQWLADEIRVAAVGADNASVEKEPPVRCFAQSPSYER